MKKNIFLLFIIVVGFSVGDVQKELITLKWDKTYSDDLQHGDQFFFNFENASFPDVETNIPVFCRIYKLKSDKQNFMFVVENAVFEEYKGPTDFEFPIELPNDIQIKTQMLNSGSDQKLQLQIVPIKKVGDKIFLLKNFELKRIPVITKSAAKEQYNWKSESVLKSGKWLKISTSEKGIYKIPYSKLTEWGFSNPSKVNVFGFGGAILSENPADIKYDDLAQNAIWHGQNSGADCLFFYAPGVNEWKLDKSGDFFIHEINNYSTKGFFFLSEDAGVTKEAELLPEIQNAFTHEISSFNDYKLVEKDLENVLKDGSGKKWFGDKFGTGNTKNIDFELTNIDNSENVSVLVNAIGRSFQNSKMDVLFNQISAGELNFLKVNTGSQTTSYADEKEVRFSTTVQDKQFKVTLQYNASGADNNALAWLDFIEVNYRRKLTTSNEALFFREINSVGENNIVEFSIENSSSNTKLFDITQQNNVKEVPLQISGSTAKTKRVANELREYVVVNPNGNFPEPVLVGEVINQDLHSLNTPEFIIITHSNFLSAANDLANFHRSYDGMDVEVVTGDQVYNEFSSGSKNATGIRNFIKMLYDRSNKLKYVLLFGDGSFDNRNIRPETKNFIPTFQSENSLNPVASFVTDDYFVILDNDESVYNGAVDLGIGRIPASTSFEAELVVHKIINYYSPKTFGNWKNIVCFIGDDEDGNLHMGDSEKLADNINSNHKEFITDKIYFDAYLQQVNAGEEKYPDVTDAINKSVKDGVLILNYVGHANNRFMADEHVLDISNVNTWSNEKNLPVFVTATCEFSRFDADDMSIGEYVLFNPNGGGIGLFSTTRVVYAYSNFLLSRSFYDFVFETDENGNRYRMGDIMRLAKTNTINTTNKRNFSLLADPALKLSYPEHRVVTSSINGHDANAAPDTIGALQSIAIAGFISDNTGSKLTNFSGEITLTVYDKEVMMKTLGNGGETPMDYKVQENIIYQGLASVNKGDFSFSFVVPKDISYNIGEGKIVYYAKNEVVDAHGAFENFVIGSSSDDIISDNIGPDVQLYMDSPDFTSGDRTSKNPTLLAFLSDENGINTVGTGIGHDITAILDDDFSNVLVLNNFYQANIDDYTSGMVRFPMKNLAVGNHKLRLKAWDVANNSSEAEIEFEVSGEFNITEVTNYPNPVNNYTFFMFSHNQADAIFDVIIEIFDQSGRRIDYIAQQVGSNGSNSNPVRWDINESQIQIRNGIYIYRITAQNNTGVIALKSGKMMISR